MGFRSQLEFRDRMESGFSGHSEAKFGREQSKSKERSRSYERPKSELAKKVDNIELKET